MEVSNVNKHMNLASKIIMIKKIIMVNNTPLWQMTDLDIVEIVIYMIITYLTTF